MLILPLVVMEVQKPKYFKARKKSGTPLQHLNIILKEIGNTRRYTWKASCSTLVAVSTADRQATYLLLFAYSEFSGYNMPGIFAHPAAEF
jgi:hypothetical protein